MPWWSRNCWTFMSGEVGPKFVVEAPAKRIYPKSRVNAHHNRPRRRRRHRRPGREMNLFECDRVPGAKAHSPCPSALPAAAALQIRCKMLGAIGLFQRETLSWQSVGGYDCNVTAPPTLAK